MAIQLIPIDKFIVLSREFPVLDVRSPKEFQQAHYPNAYSVPLFTDEERKEVGTTYKQKSREQAIKLGLDFFGPKMHSIVNEVEIILQHSKTSGVIVHCWRGGMRSAAIAWLLDLYGFQVFQLEGGYKAFRQWVLQQMEIPYSLRILNGNTGCGKTEILHELKKMNQPTLDLEGIAGHRGSAFGGIGLPPQPSSEQFENNLAIELFQLVQTYGNRPIWVESESYRIGNIQIHHRFYQQMKNAPCIRVDLPFERRLQTIISDYGHLPLDQLKDSVQRIQKRLGGLETKTVLQWMDEGNMENAFRILMHYYDGYYSRSIMFQSPQLSIALPSDDAQANAKFIMNQLQS